MSKTFVILFILSILYVYQKSKHIDEKCEIWYFDFSPPKNDSIRYGWAVEAVLKHYSTVEL